VSIRCVRVPRCDVHHQSQGRLLTGGYTAVFGLGKLGGLPDGAVYGALSDAMIWFAKVISLAPSDAASRPARTNAFTWSMKAVN